MNCEGTAGAGIGGCLISTIINITIGAWCSSYCLFFIFNKIVPWYVNVVIGLIAGDITIPLAIILLVLSFFGIHPPLIK